jgi:hypothetical protein
MRTTGSVSAPGHKRAIEVAMAKDAQPYPAKQPSHVTPVKRPPAGTVKDAQRDAFTKMPPRGPSNLIVRSSNPLPLPKDTESQ